MADKLFLQSKQKHNEKAPCLLSEYLDLYLSNHEQALILGDFNVSVNDNQIKCSCDTYGTRNLMQCSNLHTTKILIIPLA